MFLLAGCGGSIESADVWKEPVEDATTGRGEGADADHPSAPDSAHADAGTSGAGSSDSGTPIDSGTDFDASHPADAAGATDAETPLDSGSRDDAGGSADAGAGQDAAGPTDAGIATDSGLFSDAGAGHDAGSSADSGSPLDAGGLPDAGGPPDAGSYDAGEALDAGGSPDAGGAQDAGSAVTNAPPAAAGYFSLVASSAPVTPAHLPSGTECATRIRRSTWEIRPTNAQENQTVPDYVAVQEGFRAAERGGFDSRWNTWLLPRVDGNFTGTTDEIIQWAACKWGLPDNVVRAVACQESTWYQYLHYADATPYHNMGSGDLVTDDAWCRYIAGYGVPYKNPCPSTFGIVGVKAREAGSGYRNNNNGAFPFNKDSTAFALDFFGAEMRGCLEGWVDWLGGSYGPGDLWGCVGYWYSGEWHSSEAERYVGEVKARLDAREWLTADFATQWVTCSSTHGCPE